MNKKLLEILACPICKGKLIHDKTHNELICPVDRLAFQILDGMPVMLEQEARKLPDDEEIQAA